MKNNGYGTRSNKKLRLSQIQNATKRAFANIQSQKSASDNQTSYDDFFDYDLQAELERQFQELFGKPSTKV